MTCSFLRRQWRTWCFLTVAALAACSSDGKPELPTAPVSEQSKPAPQSRQRVELPPRTKGSSGIRGAGPETESSRPGSPTDEFDIVTVFWGTNRKAPSGVRASGIGSFTTENGRRLALGFAHVTIPKIGREVGSIQRPKRYSSLYYTLYPEKEDPRRHFTIGDFKSLEATQFASAADATLANASRFKDQAIVFVHGYNTTFEAAIFRTAQLAFDLEFDGVPYVFSWPSGGAVQAYIGDKDRAKSAQRYLLEYLELIAKRTNVRRIHLIAHSMGTLPLLEVLNTVSSDSERLKALKIEQVILAAPDIERDVFDEISTAIRGAGKPVTLYASSTDFALTASRVLAGGLPRAGEVTRSGPVVVSGVDSIDISDAGGAWLMGLNHSTFAERSHVVKDLQLLIEKGVRPPDQRMPIYQRVTVDGSGAYWRYVRN